MLRGSIPPTGIPLPFISAGGTFLSVFMGAIGVLLNISGRGKNELRINIFRSLEQKYIKQRKL